MSSSRNKRKRADGDPTAMAAAAPSRRRGREERSGAEPTDLAAPKNEGESSNNSISSSSSSTGNNPATLANTTGTIGESSSASGNAGTVTAPQHTQAAVVTAAVAKEKDKATRDAADETEEEKKRESEPDAASHPVVGVGTATMANPGTVTRDNAQQNDVLPSAALPPASETGVPSSTASAPSTKKKGANSNNTRESKLKAMISHRKLLLERVKSGRSAARSRIVDVARRDAQNSKTLAAMGEPSKGNAAAPPKAAALSEKARDEAEVAAFKKLSKSALQAAKKQRAENIEAGAAQEKRSSLSLRKGASVGKNMKAALSSLIPGGAMSSSSVPAVASSAQPQHVGAKAGASLPATAAGAPRIPGQLPLPTKKQKSSSQLSQAMSSADPIPKVARSGSQKNIKASANAARGGTSSSQQPAASLLPLHAGLTSPVLPTNRLGPPPVVCPEAVALRERKKAIRSKLLEHFKQQQKRISQAEHRGQDASSHAGAPTTATDDPKKIVAAASLAMSAATGPKPTAYLPRRRRTHWDNLLEEMKWMATDFLEERKWKISAARTLGSALQATPGVKVVKHRIEEKPVEMVVDEPSSEQETTSETKPNGKAHSKTAESDEKSSEESKAKVSTSGSYSKPTIDDTTSSRKVARIIANMAHELGSATFQACALSQSDRAHTKALERHVAVRKGIEQDRDNGATAATTAMEESSKYNDKSMAESAGEEGSVGTGDATNETDEEPKDKAGSFQRISKAVEAVMDNSPSKTARKNSKRGKAGSGGKVEGGHLSLTTWQQETTEFIEKKWGHSNGPGAILTGPRASGKTIAVCSLLWKRRTSGPQLLVCSPYRVVRTLYSLTAILCHLAIFAHAFHLFSSHCSR